MSRTYRRKNGWNKKYFTEYDRDWLDHMSGENVFPHISFHRRKYNGLTAEKILERLDAKYHSDNLFYRTNNHGRKDFAKWWLRHNMNQDLRKAIKNGNEDDLDINESNYKKKLNGWWLWWD